MFEKQKNFEAGHSEAIFSRHSIKGEGSEYEQLSPDGVEKAKKKAGEELVPLIESAEDGTVIFLGGNTNEARTASTLKVYSDQLKESFKGKENVIFFDRNQIKEESKKSGYLETARRLQEEADKNTKAKIVIDMPLLLKNFAKRDWWYEKDGSVKAEQEALLKKYGKDYSGAIKEWFGHGGVINSEQRLPKPEEIAESYLDAIKRLENFIGEFSGMRKTKTVFAGHSFEIDALLTYLANDGKVTPEGFEKIGGKVIDTAELSFIEPDNEGNIHLKYRGEEFVLPKTENKEETKQNE